MQNKLEQIRKHRGITQLQLALISGVPQQTISAIESGERENPGILTVIKLAAALACTVDEIFQADCDEDQDEQRK